MCGKPLTHTAAVIRFYLQALDEHGPATTAWAAQTKSADGLLSSG